MNNDNKTVLAIVAHPDDAEFLCAGTLALLKEKGWRIEVATMTGGDCGSMEYSREKISEIRKREAASAAGILNARYHCLECDDVFLMYDKPTLLKTISLVRKVRPTLVLTMSPSCYMVDHETTSRLVQTACFSAGIDNIKTEGSLPYHYIPYLYYLDPMEGKDIFGREVKASTIVNISDTMKIKEQMLLCHKSQQNWLMAHHGMNEYIQSMKEVSKKRGIEISTKYAEGFRQHLGHAFPQDNVLKRELNQQVVVCDSFQKIRS
ncbi:MAG TPA: PIG-L family deacetylase [Hanamia sp.]|nr:PIG-L family deacetylase [Hanamia sp.]